MTEPSAEHAVSSSPSHLHSLRVIMALAMGATAVTAMGFALLHRITENSSGSENGVLFAVTLLALLIANGAFAIGWLIFGDDHLLVRCAFVLGSACCDLAGFACLNRSNAERWTTLIAISLGMLLVPLLIIRVCGFRCLNEERRESRTEAHQFTIRDLLVTTTLVACALGIGRLIQFKFLGDFLNGLAIFSLIASIGAFTWMFGLIYRRRFVGIVVIAIYSVTAGRGMGFFEGPKGEELIWLIFGGLIGMVHVAYLEILRMHGYRFGRGKTVSEAK